MFDPTMHTRAVTRLAIETDLRRAIDNHQLELHYQPIMWLQGNKIVGVEALVRWRRPDGTLVPPGDFIPVAEETGIIRPIGPLGAARGVPAAHPLAVRPAAGGRAVVYAIVSLATALGIRVTGEGIETTSQLSTLIELECNHGQGFLLGRPAPPDEVAARLRTVNPTEVTVPARLARLQ